MDGVSSPPPEKEYPRRRKDEWNDRECNQGANIIYVADLAAYNHGILFGMWIDCDRDETDIMEDIEWMLSWSPVRHLEYCEEWAIHDSEGFGNYSVSEYERIEKLAEITEAMSTHGEAYTFYLSYYNRNGNTDEFEEKYRGEWDSVTDYVEDYYEQYQDLSNMPEELLRYIDWSAIARDWECSSIDAFENGKTVYIFSK